MFDLVNKYRTPVMWLCVVLMCGFGAWFLIAELFEPGANPEREVGKFTIPGGKEVVVTDRMVYEASLAPQRLGYLRASERQAEQGDKTPLLARELGIKTEDELEALWAFIVLREGAKAAGIETTDASFVDAWNSDVRRAAATGQQAPAELKLDEYQSRFREEVREFFRDLASAKRYRSLLNPPEETTYAKLFERFKTDFEQIEADFVFFDGAAKEIKFDPRGTAEDRAELEKWWSEEAQKGIRAAKQIQEQGDFEVLYARFQDLADDAFNAQFETVWGVKAAEAGLVVTDADVEARFNAFREAYKGAVDAGVRAAAAASRPTPSDLDAAKERVRRELLVVKLAELAYKQATLPIGAPSFEQLRDLYGFKVGTATKLDAPAVSTQPDFGSSAAQSSIFAGFAAGTLKKGDILNYAEEGFGAKGPVDDPARSVSVWRVLDRRDAREPTLEDPGILDYAVEKYVDKKRQDAAKAEADAFRKALEDMVVAAIKDRAEALDKEMTAAVDAEIAKQGLSREKTEDRPKVLQIENAERVKRNEKLDVIKGEEEPAAFKKIAADQGLTVRSTGRIKRAVPRAAQFKAEDAKLPTEEKAVRFFRKAQRMAAVAALKKGRVSQVEAEPTWAAAAVILLVDRHVPEPSEMWSLSEAQMQQLRRAVNPAQAPEWNYEALKSPAWFKLNVPSLDSAVEERAKQKAVQEESKRKQAEREKARLQKKAATVVDGYRDPTSPVKSGDDW